MNTNSTYNWALTRVDSPDCVSIFEVLDSKFTMLMIKSEIFQFCCLQVTFCLKITYFEYLLCIQSIKVNIVAIL